MPYFSSQRQHDYGHSFGEAFKHPIKGVPHVLEFWDFHVRLDFVAVDSAKEAHGNAVSRLQSRYL